MPHPRRYLPFACSSLCLLLPLASAAADDCTRLNAIVSTAIKPVMAQYHIPGMAVAVSIDGQRCFVNFGVTKYQHESPVTEHTLFELGSVSKTFTATLATYAQELGKLSLADAPGRYLPALRGSALDKVSLLNLGTYTAGGFPLQFADDIATEPQMLHYFQHWQPDAAPGTQRRYSNPSIGLMGRATAAALQRDFADALTHDLLPQLGLTNTYVQVPASAMARYAWGHNQNNQPVRVNPGMFDAEAYGVKSSAADMLHYLELNNDGSTLPAPVRRALEATHIGYFAVGKLVQGLGWEQLPYPVTLKTLQASNSADMAFQPQPARPLTPPQLAPASTWFGKTGSTGGFGAYLAFVPAHKLGIVLLANKSYPIEARLAAAHAILTQISAPSPAP